MSIPPIVVRAQRNGSYWRAVWIDPVTAELRSEGLGPAVGCKRATRKPKLTEGAAWQKAREVEKRLNAPAAERARAAAPTLAAWIARYLELRTDIGPATRKEISTTRDYLVKHFGADRRIDTITRADAAAFRAYLSRVMVGEGDDVRPAMTEQTIRKHIRACRVLFGANHGALALDLIAFNPFDRQAASPPRVDKTWRYVTAEQTAALLDACPNDSWRVLVALCRWAGLRLGEAMRLTWANVDFDTRQLTVEHEGRQTTKKRTRVVPIQPALMVELIRRYNSAAEGEPVVSLPSNNIRRDFRVIVKRAKLEPWDSPFHTLRKNLRTDWDALYPASDVSDWLGHSDEVGREHYHQTKDETLDAVTGRATPRTEADELREQVREQAEAIAKLKAELVANSKTAPIRVSEDGCLDFGRSGRIVNRDDSAGYRKPPAGLEPATCGLQNRCSTN